MPVIDTEATKYQCDSQENLKKIQKKSGHWNQKEHEPYLNFLQENGNHNKGQRLFKRMSQIIGTRTPSQCRSHHQKFNPQKPRDKIMYSYFQIIYYLFVLELQIKLLKTKQLVRLYMNKHKEKDQEDE